MMKILEKIKYAICKIFHVVPQSEYDSLKVKYDAMHENERQNADFDRENPQIYLSYQQTILRHMQENKQLSKLLDNYKQKYADEVQKRLELISLIDKQGGNDETNTI